MIRELLALARLWAAFALLTFAWVQTGYPAWAFACVIVGSVPVSCWLVPGDD